MLKIGIIGGIGSGKSSVASYCRKFGFCVINGDEIAHDVLSEPVIIEQMKVYWQLNDYGQTTRNDLKDFSHLILIKNNIPNRHEISKLVFSLSSELKFLTKILQSEINDRINSFIKAISSEFFKGIVLDVPLLYEVGLNKVCNEVWFVEADLQTRIKRYYHRNTFFKDLAEAESDLIQRELYMFPLIDKKRKSNRIIENNGNKEDVWLLVDNILKQI